MVDPEPDLAELNWLSGQQVGQSLKTYQDLDCSLSTSNALEKPPYRFGALIEMAIQSRPEMRMTLSEIYDWVTRNFDYYKHSQSSTWKNSIRHNLSLSKRFTKIPREPDNPGKGSYWTVNTLQRHLSNRPYKKKGTKTRNQETIRQTMKVTPHNHKTSQETPVRCTTFDTFPSILINDSDSNSLLECLCLTKSLGVIESVGIPFQKNENNHENHKNNETYPTVQTSLTLLESVPGTEDFDWEYLCSLLKKMFVSFS